MLKKLLVLPVFMFSCAVNAMDLFPLHEAAERGNVPEIRRLLMGDEPEDVNKQDVNGDTPLCVAVAKGHCDAVKALMQIGRADVNIQGRAGETPLIVAARHGHLDMVKILVRSGRADVNKRDNKGNSPLYWAAYKGFPQIVNILLNVPDVNIYAFNKNGKQPLKAAKLGSRERELIRLFPARVWLNSARFTFLLCAQRLSQTQIALSMPNIQQHICWYLTPDACSYDTELIRKYNLMYIDKVFGGRLYNINKELETSKKKCVIL